MHTGKNLTELKPLSWISANDLAKFTGASTAELWSRFCEDAFGAMMDSGWNGAPWQFAIVGDGGVIETHDAWDMKSGLRAPSSDSQLERISYPATWNSGVSPLSNKLAEALRVTLSTSRAELTNWGDEACILIKRRVAKIGTFTSLKIALAHIALAQKDLVVVLEEDHSKSEFYFTARLNNPMHSRETVTIKTRIVLEQLTNIQGSWRFSPD